MSEQARSWAREQQGLSPTMKFVLVMIADEFNEVDGLARCSVSSLARITGLSVASIVRSVRALEKVGLIEREAWDRTTSGGRATNRYRLPQFALRGDTLEQLPPAEEVLESVRDTPLIGDCLS